MTMLGQKKSISNKEDFIKSIDALFLKLELAYHYQFYKVFGTDEKLKEGKKLWAFSLKDIAPEIILDAVENVISSQSYLHLGELYSGIGAEIFKAASAIYQAHYVERFEAKKIVLCMLARGKYVQ